MEVSAIAGLVVRTNKDRVVYCVHICNQYNMYIYTHIRRTHNMYIHLGLCVPRAFRSQCFYRFNINPRKIRRCSAPRPVRKRRPFYTWALWWSFRDDHRPRCIYILHPAYVRIYIYIIAAQYRTATKDALVYDGRA